MTILPALHKIVAGFVRRTWLVTLVAVLVCAMFAARAIAAYVDADRVTIPAARPPGFKRSVPPPPAPLDPDVLVERNIFCSTCTRNFSEHSSAYSGQPAILIATSVGSDALGARATIRVVPTHVQGSWGLEQTIPGVGRVTRIGGASIDVVDESGHMQRLSLLEAPLGAGPSGAATPDGPAAPTDPFAGRIKKLSEGTYEVDRDVVRELVASAGQGAGVRALPVMKHGEITGLRFLGVKSTSVASAIGLKSNDVLSAIDGEPIKTAQQLLDLYGRLDKLGSVELQGTRGGKPLVVSLRFR